MSLIGRKRALATMMVSPTRSWFQPLVRGRGCITPRGLATQSGETMQERNQRVGLYMFSVAVGTLGVAYASVPLYKVFCQVSGRPGVEAAAGRLCVSSHPRASSHRRLALEARHSARKSVPSTILCR